MGRLVIKRVINAPTSRVWKALTDKNELKNWLPFFADFEPEVGRELRFKLGRDPDHQYEHISKVVEVVDGKKLVYGWRYEGYPGDSRVTFELIAEGTKTSLVLTHDIIEPFPADNPDFAADGFKEGWNYTADGLKNYVEKNKE